MENDNLNDSLKGISESERDPTTLSVSTLDKNHEWTGKVCLKSKCNYPELHICNTPEWIFT